MTDTLGDKNMECALAAFILLLILFQSRIRRGYPRLGLLVAVAITAWLFWGFFNNDDLDVFSFFSGVVMGIVYWEQLKRLKKPRNL